MYSDFTDNVTVYIGPRNGHKKFFLIDRYDGSDEIATGKKCLGKVTNSSEGVSYPQFLTKNDTLRYWRKTLCKVCDLHYNSKWMGDVILSIYETGLVFRKGAYVWGGRLQIQPQLLNL